MTTNKLEISDFIIPEGYLYIETFEEDMYFIYHDPLVSQQYCYSILDEVFINYDILYATCIKPCTDKQIKFFKSRLKNIHNFDLTQGVKDYAPELLTEPINQALKEAHIDSDSDYSLDINVYCTIKIKDDENNIKI